MHLCGWLYLGYEFLLNLLLGLSPNVLEDRPTLKASDVCRVHGSACKVR